MDRVERFRSYRIVRFRNRLDDAQLAGKPMPSRGAVQRYVGIFELIVPMDQPLLIKYIDADGPERWRELFGASRSTVFRAIKFTTDYDPLP
jgi:hypothetical protein